MRELPRPASPAFARAGALGATWGSLNGFHALSSPVVAGHRRRWGREALGLRDRRVLPGGPREQNVAAREFRVRARRFTTRRSAHHRAGHLRWPEQSDRRASSVVTAGRDLRGRHPRFTRWGQLGLTGEWAERPITLYTNDAAAGRGQHTRCRCRSWCSRACAWNTRRSASGPIAQTAGRPIASGPKRDRLTRRAGGRAGPGLKAALPWRRATKGRSSSSTAAQLRRASRYPLTRYMYIRLNGGGGRC
jgi:hypothetical protein